MTGHILLCPNPHRDHYLETTRRAKAILEGEGHSVRISPLLSAGKEDTLPRDLLLESVETALPGAGLLVTLGGDGTMLQAARALSNSSTGSTSLRQGATPMRRRMLALIERAFTSSCSRSSNAW